MLEPKLAAVRPLTTRALVVRAGVVAAGALTVGLLPLSFPLDGGPSTADSAFAEVVAAGDPSVLDRALVAPSDAPVVLAALVLAVVFFAGQGRWLAAATMAVTPELALIVNTWVLKPLFDRPLDDYLAYPSGHTVHLVAVVCTFVLLCDSPWTRLTVTVVGCLAVTAAAAGQVGMGYHHLTDVAGGVATAAAISVLCCTAVRLAADRRRRDAPVERPGGEPQERW